MSNDTRITVNLKREDCPAILKYAVDAYVSAKTDKAKAFCDKVTQLNISVEEVSTLRANFTQEKEKRKRVEQDIKALKKKINVLEERSNTLSTLLNKSNLTCQALAKEVKHSRNYIFSILEDIL